MPMVSLQMSDEILKKFDEVQQESGYTSRSEALRGAILLFLNDKSNLKTQKGEKRAIISVSYRLDIDTLDEMSGIDHSYENLITGFTEYLIDEEKIRVYLLKGEISKINEFINRFNKIKDSQTSYMFV